MKKQKLTKSIFSTLMGLLLIGGLLAGCTGNSSGQMAASGSNNPGKGGTVTISGSTSVQPLAQILSDEFTSKNSDIKVDVQAGGSSAGIKNAYSGISDIGNASRDLKDDEKSWGLDVHTIAIDGIAVVINPKNNVTELSQEQIVKIFRKEITNWKEVGGDDKDIIVVSREDGSGTREAFEGLLNLVAKEKNPEGKEIEVSLVKYDIISNENGIVKATVNSKDNAIGYISMGYLDNNIKPVKVNGVEASVENIKNKSYSLWRPFNMVTKGQLNSETQAFLDFIKSDEGQKIVSEEGYISYKAVE